MKSLEIVFGRSMIVKVRCIEGKKNSPYLEFFPPKGERGYNIYEDVSISLGGRD